MKPKAKEWAKRYIPAEIIAMIFALIAVFLAFLITKNRIIIAFTGTVGDNVGYYGSISLRDILKARKLHKEYGFLSFFKNIRNLLVEFGVSEIFDFFLIRPFFMWFFPIILNNFVLGILIGKIVADITFYIPTIIMYEFRKKHFID